MRLVYDGIDYDRDTDGGVDHRLKLFDENKVLIFEAVARNESVAANAWRSWAGCPPGEYTIGVPEINDDEDEQRSMGPWFIPVYGIPGHDGIGIHGGGSCVAPHSMALHQGWCPTENCFRTQNADLVVLVAILQKRGATSIPFTVAQRDEAIPEEES